MKALIDPLIISLSGTVKLPDEVIAAIRSGQVESEGAFARFYGICNSLAPHWFISKKLEAHEAFWSFDRAVAAGVIDGEVAWFQTGVYSKAATVAPVPLLMHAACEAVSQLGQYTFEGARIQVPILGPGAGAEAVQMLLDQFAALAPVQNDVQVRAVLMSRSQPERWAGAATDWFERTYVEPLAVHSVDPQSARVSFDDRWSLREAGGALAVSFTSPEWSPVAAAALTVVMIEAARAAGLSETVLVDIACVHPPTRLGTENQ